MYDEAANTAAALATIATARALAARGCRRIVVSGSCVEALPGTAVGRLPYAQAKREVHEALTALPGATCAHVFGVTGPGEAPRRAVPHVVRSLLAGRPVDVSVGTQRRDVLHVDDVARGLLTTLEAPATATVDICRGEAPHLRELFEALEEETGTAGLVSYGAAAVADTELYDAVGDAGALRGLGWSPSLTQRETAADVVAWWRGQR